MRGGRELGQKLAVQGKFTQVVEVMVTFAMPSEEGLLGVPQRFFSSKMAI